MWQYFLSVIALVVVIEGVLPFLSPPLWRKMMRNMSNQNDRTLRIIGLASMLLGLALLLIVHLN